MPYAPLLNETEISAALGERPAWHREGEELVREVRCPTFMDAIRLVDQVADAAEAADHHPDIDIRWRRVTFRLTTKAAGGLTERDLGIVATIDGLVPAEWPV
jgi:4a-hydroxytetrahydrobiopterin dehydratase